MNIHYNRKRYIKIIKPRWSYIEQLIHIYDSWTVIATCDRQRSFPRTNIMNKTWGIGLSDCVYASIISTQCVIKKLFPFFLQRTIVLFFKKLKCEIMGRQTSQYNINIDSWVFFVFLFLNFSLYLFCHSVCLLVYAILYNR